MKDRRPYRPVLRTQADVESMWKQLCRPLGWTRRDLWFVIVESDGRPFPIMSTVEDLPEDGYVAGAAGLVELWQAALEGDEREVRFAVMLCRPGGPRPTFADEEWARAIYAAARGAGISLEVIHLASDSDIVPVPLDQLRGVA